jgi:glycosyltransferase involved in cell wall biosynthesis
MNFDIVFWINDLNLHLAPLVSALSVKNQILVIAGKEYSDERRKDGWDFIPSFGNSKILIAPNITEIKNIYDQNRKAIHIFLGINAFKSVHNGFLYARRKDVKIGIITESGLNFGVKGKLRRIKSIVNYFRYSADIDFILTMGYLGEEWYRKSLFPSQKIFPFLYVTELNKETVHNPSKIISNQVNIVIVAQCIKRKNIDSVLICISELKHLNWNMVIIGEGNQKENLITLSHELGISNRVEFLGTVTNQKIQKYYLNADFSILPSKWDGWGAVVNESLMNGTPVICSNKCGASCLITNTKFGLVFDIENKDQLRSQIQYYIEKGRLLQKERREIEEWSLCIQKENVANYTSNIISHVLANYQSEKPNVPWL